MKLLKKIVVLLKNRWGKPIIFSFVMVILTITKLRTPLTGDVLVSFGSAFEADKLEVGFPVNVYQSWNLRGIGYKYIIYLLYRFSILFCDINDPRKFEVISLALYYIFFFSIAYIFIRMLKSEIDKLGLSILDVFFVFFFVVMTNSQFIGLQAEEIAILFVLGLSAFTNTNVKTLNYLSGIFLLLLLQCKLITITYAAFPLLVLVSLGKDYRNQLKRFIISAVVFGIITATIYWYVLPLEIKDTIDATYFQASFSFSGIRTILSFIKYYIRAIYHLPFLFAGIIFTLVGLYISRADKNKLLFLFLLLVSASIPVIVQAKWFSYHYVPFLITAVLSMLLVVRSYDRAKLARLMVPTMSITFFLWVFSIWIITSGLPYHDPIANTNYYKFQVYKPRISALQYLDQKYNLSNEPQILFLGDGLASYIIDAKSYLRYTYPLPLQRIESNPNLAQTYVYQETLNAVMNYKGRYIYIEFDWFILDNLPAIKVKLDDEYEIIFTVSDSDVLKKASLLERR